MAKTDMIIFDLDDTLISSSVAYQKALTVVGIPENSQEYLTARKLVKEVFSGPHVSARNRLLYFKKLLEIKGDFGSSQLLDLMQKYEDALELDIRNQWQSLDRDNLMSRLAKKFRLGIITNENLRTQMIKLRAIDPKGLYFSYICTSEEVGVEKPDLKIFHHFLEVSSANASDCCMVGDSFENDFLPAQNLGMKAILTAEFVANNNSIAGAKLIQKLDQLESVLPTFQ